MKIRTKYAEFVGYVTFKGERFDEWRSPDKDCGRKLKFKEPKNAT